MRGVAFSRPDSPPSRNGARGVRSGSRSFVSRESRVRSIRRGDSGPAVSEIRSILVGLDLLETASDVFDDDLDSAVRAFQQSRGIGVDGLVGDETWGALDAARWRLGARTLFHSVPDALVGEDVRTLQERLLEMGYDAGRADAIYGAR